VQCREHENADAHPSANDQEKQKAKVSDVGNALVAREDGLWLGVGGEEGLIFGGDKRRPIDVVHFGILKRGDHGLIGGAWLRIRIYWLGDPLAGWDRRVLGCKRI